MADFADFAQKDTGYLPMSALIIEISLEFTDIVIVSSSPTCEATRTFSS